MLDPSTVDLGSIAMALEDHSYLSGSWWIDAQTGEVWYWGEDDQDAASDPDDRDDARSIQPLPSSVAYRDMEDFIDRVPDRRAADLLDRGIAGRGAFRRFKDTLLEFPELRDEWFRFADVRMQRRAIEFLVDEGLIDEAGADRALAGFRDPPVAEGLAGSGPAPWPGRSRLSCVASTGSDWWRWCSTAPTPVVTHTPTPTWTWP